MLSVTSPCQFNECDGLTDRILGAAFFEDEIKVVLATMNVGPCHFLPSASFAGAYCIEIQTVFVGKVAKGLLHQVFKEGTDEFSKFV